MNLEFQAITKSEKTKTKTKTKISRLDGKPVKPKTVREKIICSNDIGNDISEVMTIWTSNV